MEAAVSLLFGSWSFILIQARCEAALPLYHQCHHLLKDIPQPMNTNIQYHLSPDALIRDSGELTGGKQTERQEGRKEENETGDIDRLQGEKCGG